MYLIQTTSAERQEQQFSLYGMNLRLTLHYNPVLRGYQFDLWDIATNRYLAQSRGLAAEAPALLESNLPFVLVLHDTSGAGIGSISPADFANRLALFIMTREEYRETIWANTTTEYR